MKVIYFSQDYTTHDYRFLTKLAQSPHEVWYVRFETTPVPFETRPIPSDIQVVNWMGCFTYQLHGWRKAKLFLDFRRVLRQIQPDLVHAGPVQTCGFFVALSGFKPFLLMSWGSDILTRSYENTITRLITKFTLNRASMIASDCLAVRNKILELTAYPPNRIIVFPWGVDLTQFHPTISRLNLREKLGWQDSKIVISTRSLEPIYGIDVSLKAIQYVMERRPEVRFILLGDGSLRAEVEDFIARHNLGPIVHLPGRVEHNLLPDYFNEADLYVSSSYSDGTSVSLLEAMACELPVVVTDISSNREWVHPGTNGWLVPPGDSEALGTAIIEALEQEDRAKTMGQANISLVHEEADWEVNFNTLLGAYQRLAG